MPSWFVTRAHHEEVVNELRADKAALQKECYRLKDLIFQKNFGVQLHDTLPGEASEEAEPEVELTPDQQYEEQQKDKRQEQVRRLRSIARTNPSRLPKEMERVLARDGFERAHSAHPSEHIFTRARAEVSKA